MCGYYKLDPKMIKTLPLGSKNIENDLYELCYPLIVKDKTSVPEEILYLYETMEIPIVCYHEFTNSFSVNPKFCTYIKEFSKYLKLNVKIELLEEGKIGHLLRVGKYAKKLSLCLDIPQKRMKDIYIAALFHDVGKSKIPFSIIGKKEKLSREEYEIMKKHCEYSYDILKDFLPKNILDSIRSHHERCDGSGYPDGIIPSIEAKIIGIADSFDAMVSNRVYQKQKTIKDALNELFLCGKTIEEGGKGTLFDLDLVQKFSTIF